MSQQLELFELGLPAELNAPMLPVFVAIGIPGAQLKFLADPNDGTITIGTDNAEDLSFDVDNFDLLAELLIRSAEPAGEVE